MTSKEALDKIKYIDLHGQFPYNYYLKDDLEYKEVLEILDIALEQAQKQEKLLKLYQRLYKDFNGIGLSEVILIKNKIKELEK